MAHTDPAPPRLRADAERNRLRLLAAASEVFAERGVDVTLDDIARHAGVGVGTAYRRFANKDDLIEALFEQKLVAMSAIADEAATAETGWDGIVAFLTGAQQLMARDRALRQVLFTLSHGRDRVARARAELAPRVGRLVERAQREGSLRADLGPLDMPVINLMLSTVGELSRDVRPELWQRMLGIVLDGLRADGARPLAGTPLAHDEWEAALASWR